jgi:hypothetical protein
MASSKLEKSATMATTSVQTAAQAPAPLKQDSAARPLVSPAIAVATGSRSAPRLVTTEIQPKTTAAPAAPLMRVAGFVQLLDRSAAAAATAQSNPTNSATTEIQPKTMGAIPPAPPFCRTTPVLSLAWRVNAAEMALSEQAKTATTATSSAATAADSIAEQ